MDKYYFYSMLREIKDLCAEQSSCVSCPLNEEGCVIIRTIEGINNDLLPSVWNLGEYFLSPAEIENCKWVKMTYPDALFIKCDHMLGLIVYDKNIKIIAGLEDNLFPHLEYGEEINLDEVLSNE